MPSTSFVRVALLAALSLPGLPGLARAQTEQAPTASAPQDPRPGPLDPITTGALERLTRQIDEKRRDYEDAVARNDAAAEDLAKELRMRRWEFAGLASRIDVKEFEAPEKTQFDLQQELEQLVRPLIKTIKDATEEPRQVADLKARIELLRQRQQTAEQALRTVEQTRNGLPDGSPARLEAERELTERWRPTIESLRGDVLVLNARLLARTNAQKSLYESVTQTTQKFLQSSGLSLLLAGLVFVSLFFGLRFVSNRLMRRSAAKRGFSRRLLEVVLHALCLLTAVAATLAVPYVRNDWLLLAVGIVFLVGAGWVLVRMLPQFYEQIRLILNIGGVREGERILIDGLPFLVEALRFHSRLRNPDLEGGFLRVPIQDLIGKRSRPSGRDEPWFPCRVGDAVMLRDGVVGTVRTQTPEVVVIDDYHAPRSYPTAAFLALHPRNLSGGFAVHSRFGIDYKHQAEGTTTIPERLQQALAEGLRQTVGAGELLRVRVELAAAGTSSLDLAAIAEFAGSAGQRYLELERLQQRLLVEACTKNRWTIPFPQLVVHKPAGG